MVQGVSGVGSRFSVLCLVVAMQTAGSFVGIMLAVDFRAKHLVMGLVIAFGVLAIGRSRVRVAFWVVVVWSAIGLVSQLVPPIEAPRLGIAVLCIIVIALCIRELRAADGSPLERR